MCGRGGQQVLESYHALLTQRLNSRSTYIQTLFTTHTQKHGHILASIRRIKTAGFLSKYFGILPKIILDGNISAQNIF